MRVVLWIVGNYMAVMGFIMAVKPALGKRLTDWMLKDKVSRRWALLTLAVGAVIFWAAPASHAPVFIQILGGISVGKGVYLLVAPRDQLMGVMEWWYRLPPSSVRLWGLVAVIIGVGVLGTL